MYIIIYSTVVPSCVKPNHFSNSAHSYSSIVRTWMSICMPVFFH